MKTPEEMLEGLSKLSTTELQMVVDMHILFYDTAPIEIIKEHHLQQSLAQKVLNQRMGRVESNDDSESNDLTF